MRHLFLVATTVTAGLLVSSCRDAKVADPDEYLRQIVEASVDCDSDVLATPTLDELKDEIESEYRELDAIAAPREVAGEHKVLVTALETLNDAVKDVDTLSDLQSDESLVELVAEVRKNNDEWREAMEADFGVTIFSNEGASMEPAFSAGEAFALQVFDGSLERWQPVVFEFPLDPDRLFFKRAIALPGEVVEVRDEQIFIDGAVLDGDTYALATPNYDYGPREVPADSYFVLGDNRRNSFDSHAWGLSCASDQDCDFVPADNILGELPADAIGTHCD